MKQLIFLITILSFANNCFAKENDTISNWQVYKDSHLLFKSHILDSHKYRSTIRTSKDYKSLNVTFISDSRRCYKTKIEFVFGTQILCQSKISLIVTQ